MSMSKIELVRHGDKWRYIGDDGRISRTFEGEPPFHYVEAPDMTPWYYSFIPESDWLTGLHAVCERLRYEQDQREANDGPGWLSDAAVAEVIKQVRQIAEAEYNRELARCSACGGKGWINKMFYPCEACHGTGKADEREEVND